MDNTSVLGIVILVIIAFVTLSGTGKSDTPRGSLVPSSNISQSRSTSGTTNTSGSPAQAGEDATKPTREATLSLGNAKSVYQPFKEYVTISNKTKGPLNITSWMLKNGKEDRTYYLQGRLSVFPSDTAFIPRGVRFISPTGHNVVQDIVLEKGESAIITTGKVGASTPYNIVSFKENICSGYLENLPEYAFTPPLRRNCPDPSDELGQEFLDTECKKFVDRLPSCKVPDFEPKDRAGEPCNNCVNNTPLSSVCVAYIKSHFSYPGCIANHLNDPDFSGNRWRVFLGLGWEMWAKEYESIELYNRSGQLVDIKQYE